jgi:putative endopeptidase
MNRFRQIAAAALLGACAAAGADGLRSGVDLAYIDHSVKPGDDFEAYANGAWTKTAVIPADRAETGVFFQVFDKAERRNAELVRDLARSHPAAGSDERRIADYYAAFMNEAAIDRRGLAPLKPQLDEIAAIQTPADLARVLGEGLRADADALNNGRFTPPELFGLWVAQGLNDPAHNMPYLMQGGLGMPGRDYYLSTDAQMAKTREAYRVYIGALLKLAGFAGADQKASAILGLETKIAQVEASIVDSQDVHKAGAPQPLSALAQGAPGLDWAGYFKAAGLDGQKQIVLWQPDAIRQLSALTASEPLPLWKDYLAYHALDMNAELLPKAYAELHFGFHIHTLQGTPKERPRWKRALTLLNRDLGDAVGKIYVQRYFPASSKQKVQQMAANLLAAFDARVDTLDWMTPTTRQKAKAKIATLKVEVGYPETWRDYSDLEIRADDALGNHLRAELHEYHHQIAKLGQPVDRAEWWMTPQTVNAVNLPLQNALNFPAAYLEPPYFDPQADDAVNYGSMGATIGHEISHSFDAEGAEFDSEGRLSNWWTPEDHARFEAAGKKLVEQYNAYEPLPGLHVNGQQTLDENIADVSGLAIAYAAYHRSLDGKPAPVIDSLSADQRFFLAYAQSWRGKIREAALREQVVMDAHAPDRFRVFTVRNIDAWYEAFKPQPGDTLYLAPQDRVRIW